LIGFGGMAEARACRDGVRVLIGEASRPTVPPVDELVQHRRSVLAGVELGGDDTACSLSSAHRQAEGRWLPFQL